MRRLRFALAFTAALFFTFSPLVVLGQVDSRCFTDEQCKNQRGFASDEGDFDDYFYWGKDAQAACGVIGNDGLDATKKHKVGFCLAAGEATTKISFGGKRNFSDIGDFIKYFYQYGMWIAGILAVATIVVAGFIWVMSGGNADSISSAKKKIAGSITGLILLSLSYVILSSVNPYLVELRLPKTWMVNTIQIAPPFCSGVENAKLAYLGLDTLGISDEEKKLKLEEAITKGYTIDPKAGTITDADKAAIAIIEKDPNLSFQQKLAAMNVIIKEAEAKAQNHLTAPVCGHRYLVQNTNGQSCVGDICGGRAVCLPFTTPPGVDTTPEQVNIASTDIVRKSACWNGALIIDYKADDIIQGIINKGSDNWLGKLDSDNSGNDWLQDEVGDGMDTVIQVYPVCQITTPPPGEENNYDQSANSEDRKQIHTTFGQNPFMIDGSNYVYPTVKILSISRPGTFKEHLIRYNFSDEDIQKLKDCVIHSDGDATSGKSIYAKTVGIVVKNQINVNWNGWELDPFEWGADALVYTYQESPGKGTAAPWIRKEMDLNNFGDFGDFKYFIPKGYIPIEHIDGTKGKGLYLDFNLPPDTIQNLGAAVSDSYGD